MKNFPGGISDIQIHKDTMSLSQVNFSTLYKKHSFKSTPLEAQIKNLQYSGEKKSKDRTVENSYFPPFIVSFYKYIFHNSKIPTESLLAEYYFKEYFEDVENGNIKLQKQYINDYSNLVLNKKGVYHRLLRTYPSIIRDFHFLLLCYEDNAFRKSYYSLRIDYFEGYDIVVKGKNISYGISLYVDTQRGNFYKKKKTRRHSYEKMIEIELKAERNECSQCGDIYLFSKKHVIDLKKILIQKSMSLTN